MSFIAQALKIQDPQLTGTSPFTLQGPLPTDTTGTEKFSDIASVINAIVNILFPIALFIAFLLLVQAGFNLSRSMGDAGEVKKAQSRITNIVVGLILLAISYWLAQIATRLFFPS